MVSFSPLYPTMEKKPFPLYPIMEENLLRCIPQRRKTFSVVAHNGGKSLPLWGTTEENLRRCGIQCWRFFCVVSLNTEKSHLILLCCIYYEENVIVRCGIQHGKASVLWDPVYCLRFCWGVEHNERKLLHWGIQRKKTLLLYPITEE